MVELIVFVVPIASVLLGAYRKLFNSEKSAIEYIDFRNKYGAKFQMLKAPQVFLTSLCFIISPIFISTGMLWSVLGGIFLLGNILFYCFMMDNSQYLIFARMSLKHLSLNEKRKLCTVLVLLSFG